MTKEEKLAQMRAELDALIDRYDMTRKCNLTREQIYARVKTGMVCLNLALVMTDVAQSLLIDMEDALRPMGAAMNQTDKRKFRQMMRNVEAAKKLAEQFNKETYEHHDGQLFAEDADWWYNIVRLIDDRTGANIQKTRLVLKWLHTLPSEIGIFKVKMSDFKRSLYEVADD